MLQSRSRNEPHHFGRYRAVTGDATPAFKNEQTKSMQKIFVEKLLFF
jgi:hypothetical protein